MLYNICDEFTKITETRGTIQNTSQCYSIEISDSAEAGNTFLLYPLNSISFSGNVYLRCTERGGHVRVNVVSFVVNAAAGSSSGSSSGFDSFTDADIEDIFKDP